MEQYISKATVVAEIERRIKETESMQPKFDQFWAGQISAFKGILKILDTLEAKEVDLEREVADYIERHKRELSSGYFDIRRIARHFYGLGIETQIRGIGYDK